MYRSFMISAEKHGWHMKFNGNMYGTMYGQRGRTSAIVCYVQEIENGSANDQHWHYKQLFGCLAEWSIIRQTMRTTCVSPASPNNFDALAKRVSIWLTNKAVHQRLMSFVLCSSGDFDWVTHFYSYRGC